MPNPFDLGSCRLLEALGFPALATTSGGFAASLGRLDMTTTRDELLRHVEALCTVTGIPVNVDAEQCFPESSGGVARTIELLADAGASGCSIEDWNPREAKIEDIDVAVGRVETAASKAAGLGLVLTARAENHLRGHDEIDDTIARLSAYRMAGADVLYAPALNDLTAISRVVEEVEGPINVLLTPGGPARDELQAIGVRRLSVGNSLARIAYGAMYEAARYLLDAGALSPEANYLSRGAANHAFN